MSNLTNLTSTTALPPHTRTTGATLHAPYLHISNKVIFGFFFGLPILVGLLYALWSAVDLLFMWYVNKEDDILLEDEEDDKKREEICFYDTGVITVAPILRKLPVDYVFPAYASLEENKVVDETLVLGQTSTNLLPLASKCTTACSSNKNKSKYVILPDTINDVEEDQSTAGGSSGAAEKKSSSSSNVNRFLRI